MILSKQWLNEWVELGEISTEEIAWTLNSIGLEVDAITSIRVPEKIVVAKVVECRAHENSDHLHVCAVDTGDSRVGVVQIVCGAPNVAAGQFVACALVGAVMPNGLEIKAAKLRGEASNGMLCSASELGLGKLNDGIMILDDSIGELVLGRELREYPVFSDDIIEIELTPNRGDCLSVMGVARDIAASLNLPLKERTRRPIDETQLGIGRVLGLHTACDLNSGFLYKVVQAKNSIKLPLKQRLRLLWAKSAHIDGLLGVINYTISGTGVILRAYDFDRLSSGEERVELDIKKLANGADGVFCGDRLISVAGIWQNGEYGADNDSVNIVLESSFVPAESVAMVVGEDKKQAKDDLVFRTTRGSEPSLNLGADELINILANSVSVCNGSQQVSPPPSDESADQIRFDAASISKMIGQSIPKNEIVRILKNLGFELNIGDQEQIYATPPAYRHDIKNMSDICEEIVRLTGIDEIASVPMEFKEASRLGGAWGEYKKMKGLRCKAAASGYFECVSYLFDNPEQLNELGFTEDSGPGLLNPINSELSALRPTLLNCLLVACERNIKNSQKSVKLFECGPVINDGAQGQRLAFIKSGLVGEPSMLDGAKPSEAGLFEFASEVQRVVGAVELKEAKDIKWASPYEAAEVWQNGVKIGVLARLHMKIQNSRDLPKTYICELDSDKIAARAIEARAYSKLPSVSRDLSILAESELAFSKIAECIKAQNIAILKEFWPVDLYKGEELGGKVSLSIKFIFQEMDRSLTDDEVAGAVEQILAALKADFGVEIR